MNKFYRKEDGGGEVPLKVVGHATTMQPLNKLAVSTSNTNKN